MPIAELRADTAEIDDLNNEIRSIAESKAQSRGGKLKHFDDDTEKVRKRVWKAINDAYEHIEMEHPSLHRHLKDSIDLGETCIYSPLKPVDWVVSFA
jgi:hypothetical protein